MSKANKSKFSAVKRSKIVSEINDLSIDEKKEIFKILNSNKVGYTENINGIYVMFSKLSDSIIDELIKFLEFCKINQEKLECKDNEQMAQKHIIFGDEISDNTDIEKKPFSTDTKYVASVSAQIELDKYGLNIMDEKDEEEVNINRNKPKYSGIKAKIIKNGGKN